MGEDRLNRFHYLVRRWSRMGQVCATRCFDTSNGAVAFMCNDADVAYTIECVTRAACYLCNPAQPWSKPPTQWCADDWLRVQPAVKSDEATPAREIRLGRDHGEARGVYDKQATGHYHDCSCGAVWGSCYRADCGGSTSPRECPWHDHIHAQPDPHHTQHADCTLDCGYSLVLDSFGD